MRLIDLIQRAPDWRDDDTTIYAARPWSADAEAILVTPSPDGTQPIEQDGRNYDYFLETFIAVEVLEDFDRSEIGHAASASKRCARLVHYAENDA